MFVGAMHLGRAAIGVLLLSPLVPENLVGQTVRGTLSEETARRPIPNAAVTLSDTAGATVAMTLTNGEGHFTLAAPSPGVYFLSAAAIGYGRGSNGPFELTDGSPLEIELHLQPSPITLPGIRIEVERARTDKFLATQRFYRRQKRGGGYFFTPEQIEEIDPFDYQDLLSRVPGIWFVDAGWRGTYLTCASSSRSLSRPGDEAPRVYLDGMRVSSSNLETYAPVQTIVAVEVYRGGASIPLEFSATGSSCVVLVWTKG